MRAVLPWGGKGSGRGRGGWCNESDLKVALAEHAATRDANE